MRTTRRTPVLPTVLLAAALLLPVGHLASATDDHARTSLVDALVDPDAHPWEAIAAAGCADNAELGGAAAATRSPNLARAIANFVRATGGSASAQTIAQDTAGYGPDVAAGLITILDAMTLAARSQAADRGDKVAPRGLLVQSSAIVLDAVEEAAPTLAAAPADQWQAGGYADPGGVVEFGTTGADTFEEDRWLLVDPGGGDAYRNNAGGATVAGGSDLDARVHKPLALSLDLSGDDDYYHFNAIIAHGSPGGQGSNLPAAVQGSGLGGAGMLVDWQGNDSYESAGAMAYGQGAGANGVGILWDRGGNDAYRASTYWSMGSGYNGCGLLLDDGGDDTYAPTRAMAYGREGVGIVVERAGNDTYQDCYDLLDGTAAGVFMDLAGADTYQRYTWGGTCDDERNDHTWVQAARVGHDAE